MDAQAWFHPKISIGSLFSLKISAYNFLCRINRFPPVLTKGLYMQTPKVLSQITETEVV